MRPPRPASSQPGALAEHQLVAEAQRGAREVLGPLEHVHGAAADQRDGARLHRDGRAVDAVLSAAFAHPDQLVVVVAVRLAHPRFPDPRAFQPHGLDGARPEPVQADRAHPRRAAKKSSSSAAHSSRSTPPVTAGRWLKRGSARTSMTEPAAPAFGSAVP